MTDEYDYFERDGKLYRVKKGAPSPVVVKAPPAPAEPPEPSEPELPSHYGRVRILSGGSVPTLDPAKKRAQRARYEARHPERRGRAARAFGDGGGSAPTPRRAPSPSPTPFPRRAPTPEPEREPSFATRALGALTGGLNGAIREVNRGSFAGDREIPRRQAAERERQERLQARFEAERSYRYVRRLKPASGPARGPYSQAARPRRPRFANTSGRPHERVHERPGPRAAERLEMR